MEQIANSSQEVLAAIKKLADGVQACVEVFSNDEMLFEKEYILTDVAKRLSDVLCNQTSFIERAVDGGFLAKVKSGTLREQLIERAAALKRQTFILEQRVNELRDIEGQLQQMQESAAELSLRLSDQEQRKHEFDSLLENHAQLQQKCSSFQEKNPSDEELRDMQLVVQKLEAELQEYSAKEERYQYLKERYDYLKPNISRLNRLGEQIAELETFVSELDSQLSIGAQQAYDLERRLKVLTEFILANGSQLLGNLQEKLRSNIEKMMLTKAEIDELLVKITDVNQEVQQTQDLFALRNSEWENYKRIVTEDIIPLLSDVTGTVSVKSLLDEIEIRWEKLNHLLNKPILAKASSKSLSPIDLLGRPIME